MATDAETLDAGFVLPSGADSIRDGDDAIKANAKATVDLYKTFQAYANNLAGIDTPDALVAALVAGPNTDTQDALDAAYAPSVGARRHPLTGWYHVSGFGAVGDWNGSTGTDNLPAFNAAVAKLNADGGHGVVYIDAPGDYWMANGWMIDVGDVTVICHPAATVRTTSATIGLGAAVTFMGGGIQSPSNAVDAPQATRARWIGGRISATGSGTADNALGFVRYANAYAADVRLDADRKALTAQYNVDNVVFERFVVERAGVSAVTIETSCDHVTIRDFDVTAGTDHGFHIMSVDPGARRNRRVRIERGRIRAAGQWGILAGATDGLRVQAVRVDAATSGPASFTDCTEVITELAASTSAGSSWGTAQATALALANGWVTQGAGYPPPSVVRDPYGRVQLTGNIKSGTTTAGTVLTTLAAAYRPPNNRTFTVDCIDSTGAIVAARILVNSAGQVILQKGGNSFALSLDQVGFYAA